MMICGKEYPVIGHVQIGNVVKPIVDIPMMSDERWNELARQNAVDNYIKEFGTEPESVEAAVAWQRDRAYRLTKDVPVKNPTCLSKEGEEAKA